MKNRFEDQNTNAQDEIKNNIFLIRNKKWQCKHI